MDSEALKLAHKDSNLNKQNQNLLCYRYTMSQCLKKRCKGKLVFLTAQGFFRFFGKKSVLNAVKAHPSILVIYQDNTHEYKKSTQENIPVYLLSTKHPSYKNSDNRVDVGMQ